MNLEDEDNCLENEPRSDITTKDVNSDTNNVVSAINGIEVSESKDKEIESESNNGENLEVNKSNKRAKVKEEKKC
ncbi:hypothetical protein Avbf_01448 [Armadillidium vulgare]|nr:hypothetical protein Avbf_01448 [Armadillidium vulgare]